MLLQDCCSGRLLFKFSVFSGFKSLGLLQCLWTFLTGSIDDVHKVKKKVSGYKILKWLYNVNIVQSLSSLAIKHCFFNSLIQTQGFKSFSSVSRICKVLHCFCTVLNGVFQVFFDKGSPSFLRNANVFKVVFTTCLLVFSRIPIIMMICFVKYQKMFNGFWINVKRFSFGSQTVLQNVWTFPMCFYLVFFLCVGGVSKVFEGFFFKWFVFVLFEAWFTKGLVFREVTFQSGRVWAGLSFNGSGFYLQDLVLRGVGLQRFSLKILTISCFQCKR